MLAAGMAVNLAAIHAFPFTGDALRGSRLRIVLSRRPCAAGDVLSAVIADERAPGGVTYVSANYFRELGIAAALGRLIDSRDTAPVAVLSYAYWKLHFAGDRGIVGKQIEVNRLQVTLIGVAPRSFAGLHPYSAAMWLPLTGREGPVNLYGRLREADRSSPRLSL